MYDPYISQLRCSGWFRGELPKWKYISFVYLLDYTLIRNEIDLRRRITINFESKGIGSKSNIHMCVLIQRNGQPTNVRKRSCRTRPPAQLLIYVTFMWFESDTRHWGGRKSKWACENENKHFIHLCRLYRYLSVCLSVAIIKLSAWNCTMPFLGYPLFSRPVINYTEECSVNRVCYRFACHGPRMNARLLMMIIIIINK